MTKDDPVVQRVREARRKIAEKVGYDQHKLLEWARGVETRHQARVVGFQPARKRHTPR